MPLTDLKIRTLRPTDKPTKITDAEGLHLLVTPSGSKLWRMAYRFEGKQRQLAIGAYPTIPLLEARRLRDEAKRLLKRGVDPSQHKRGVVTDTGASSETFRSVADRWFAKSEADWVTAHAMRLQNRMAADVFPQIGSTPIVDLGPKDVLAIIRRIEERGAIDMARRVYQVIGKVFRFAVAEQIIPSDPTRDIADALAKPPPVDHHNSIPAHELPDLIKRLWDQDTVSALAAIFTIHTMVRTNETRFARWDEITSDGLWKIPSDRMKMRREHVVPLTPQAQRVLDRLPRDSQWLFKTPGRRDKPLSENAMLYLLYRLGYAGRCTMHGMRSSASTWLNEHEWNRDWIELQLAHVDGSVRGVYNSALYLRQRREMLQAWSDFIEPDEFVDLL